MTLVPPQRRPGVATALGSHEGRVRANERRPPGRWIWVGDFPGDPDTTTDSPPFENGVTNLGGGVQRLRFRLINEYDTQIAGAVIIPADAVAPVVVTTLAPRYAPVEDSEPVQGVGGTWVLKATGELEFTPDTGGGGGGGSGIQFDISNVGGSLDVDTSAATNFVANGGFSIQTSGQNLTLGGYGLVGTYTDKVEWYPGAGFWAYVTSGSVELFANSTGLVITDTLVQFQVPVGSNVEINLGAGSTFTLKDSGGNPILQMTEGSPDVHIPTGGSVIADL